jgi:signal recognition particle receptor subunit beta
MSTIDILQKAVNLLEIASDSQLAVDINTLKIRHDRQNYQIAVFGPFNHGKSTLLNAILGQKALPMDLIPTTGTAIEVVYGENLATNIVLASGEKIFGSGVEALEKFAVLDGGQKMREDIVSVTVSYPHPLLQMGVELVDLPGTNDREDRDIYARDRLLSADLIVHVLDARKLMTLGEREHLRDWLEARGIHTVVFVINFLNLLELEDRKQIRNRLRFVAESFRSTLPPGIGNLYQVDALPALRARLRGDDSALTTSGLPEFLSALQAIVTQQREELSGLREPQIDIIRDRVRDLLEAEINVLQPLVSAENERKELEISLKKQAKNIIKTGWETSLKKIEDWLFLPNLVSFCQRPLERSLSQGSFYEWQKENITVKLEESQQEINDWLMKAANLFQMPPGELLILPLPAPPDLIWPELPPKEDFDELFPFVVADGVGRIIGGAIGSLLVNGVKAIKVGNAVDRTTNNNLELIAACDDAAGEYLLRLNMETMEILKAYRSRVSATLDMPIVSTIIVDNERAQKLLNLQECLSQL